MRPEPQALTAALLALAAQGFELPPSTVALFGRRAFGKGDALLQAGDRWRTAYAVETGVLRMFFVRKDGREFNKNFHLEGALVLPITPAMQSQPSIFHIAAVEPSIVWCAPSAAVIQDLQAHGLWPRLQTHLLGQVLTAKLAREHDLLTLDGKARYVKLCAEQPALASRVPLSMLATYLGMTDVSLSRIRRQLSKD